MEDKKHEAHKTDVGLSECYQGVSLSTSFQPLSLFFTTNNWEYDARSICR